MHPEHFDLSSPLFLPVTEDTCAALAGDEAHARLATLSVAELAAVLALQHLPQVPEQGRTCDAIERVLNRLVAWGNGPRPSASTLLSEAQRLFNPHRFGAGLEMARQLKARFLSAEEVAAQDYLLPGGAWDTAFKGRQHRRNSPFSQQIVTPRHRERWLTSAQDKLVRTFRANLDEDLHVQGYAGIGKSYLLAALAEHLRPDRTLVLALTPGKLDTLNERMGLAGKRGIGLTFKAFAQRLISAPRSQPTGVRERTQGTHLLVQAVGIGAVGTHDAQGTLNLCLKVLELYCRSRDYTLGASHLPHLKYPMTKVDQQVLLEYASRLWGYLDANPAWGAQLDPAGLMTIKRASLAGSTVPGRYTHVLIDESQEVPAPLLQIIERGRQALITLGDEYQHAKGDIAKRAREVRQADVICSVRSGRNVERLVNPLIARHSNKSKTAFEGTLHSDVAVDHYPEGFVPPAGCVVLAASRWDTLRWALELDRANGAFSFPGRAALEDLMHFAMTAIALFNPAYYSAEQNAGGPHPEFSETPTWALVQDACRFDQSFLWVQARLEQGLRVADLTRLNARLGTVDESCLLMLAEEAGGMEFNQVLLTPELLTTEQFKDRTAFDERICAVYIAISRARWRLYLPYDVVEWIEYHHHQKFRDELAGY
jgi:hypothetical protein